MPTEGSSVSEVAATVVDTLIALPLAVMTYCLGLPLLAIGVGIVRGLQELGQYAEGKRGLRLPESREAKQLRAWRETAGHPQELPSSGVPLMRRDV